MCMWFGYNPQVNFYQVFRVLNLIVFFFFFFFFLFALFFVFYLFTCIYFSLFRILHHENKPI